MSNINEYVDFFIKRKLHEDPLWRELTVYFSPSTVPGEGEHKIMDHIRNEKNKEKISYNFSHCIYGNDSDLLLLALMTHLPNILVLRESFPNF